MGVTKDSKKINPIVSDKEAKNKKVMLQTTDGQSFGEVSLGAYSAIRGGYADSYSPVSSAEKKSIDSFYRHIEDMQNSPEAKQERIDSNPTTKKYGIDPLDFSYDDLNNWTKERGYEIHFNGTHSYYTPKYKGGFLGIGGRKMTTDETDADLKVLEQLAANNSRRKLSGTDAGKLASATFGFADGATFGLTKFLANNSTKREYEKAGLDPDSYVSFSDVTSKTVGSHPVSNAIGNMGGSMVSLGGLGKAVKTATGGLKWFTKLSPWVQNSINSGITFGLSSGAQTATNGGNVKDVLVNAGINTIGGAVGGAASGKVGELGLKILFDKGLQHKIIPEMVRVGLSSSAFAAGKTASTYFLYPEGSRPSAEDMAKDIATAFAFGAISAGIDTMKTSAQNKQYLDELSLKMSSDYERMARASVSGENDVAGMRKFAKNVIGYGNVMEAYLTGQGYSTTINGNTYAFEPNKIRLVGQDKYIKSIISEIHTVRDNANAVLNGVGAHSASTSAAGAASSAAYGTLAPTAYGASSVGATVAQSGSAAASPVGLSTAESGAGSTSAPVGNPAASGSYTFIPPIVSAPIISEKPGDASGGAVAVQNTAAPSLGEAVPASEEPGNVAKVGETQRFAPETSSGEVKRLENILIANGADDRSRNEIVTAALEIEDALDGSGKTVRGVFDDVSKITSSAINAVSGDVGASGTYWRLFGENIKAIPTGKTLTDTGFVGTYAKAFADAMKAGDPERYASAMRSVDGKDISSELPDTVMHGRVPMNAGNAGAYGSAVADLKRIIGEVDGKISTVRREIYGDSADAVKEAVDTPIPETPVPNEETSVQTTEQGTVLSGKSEPSESRANLEDLRKEYEGKEIFDGKDTYRITYSEKYNAFVMPTVKSDGSLEMFGAEIVPSERLEKYVESAERRNRDVEKRKEQERLEAEKEALLREKQAEKEKHLTAFLSGKSPMQAGKMRNTLVKYFADGLNTHEFIEKAVRDGMEFGVREENGKNSYRLYVGKNEFYSITKTAYDYGKFLESSEEFNSAGEVSAEENTSVDTVETSDEVIEQPESVIEAPEEVAEETAEEAEKTDEHLKKTIDSIPVLENDTENAITLTDKCGMFATKHTKTGENLWVVTLGERLSPEEYKDLRERVKAVGGYYSAFTKTPEGKSSPGFVFKTEPSTEVIKVFNDFFSGDSPSEEISDSSEKPTGKESKETENVSKAKDGTDDAAERMPESKPENGAAEEAADSDTRTEDNSDDKSKHGVLGRKGTDDGRGLHTGADGVTVGEGDEGSGGQDGKSGGELLPGSAVSGADGSDVGNDGEGVHGADDKGNSRGEVGGASSVSGKKPEVIGTEAKKISHKRPSNKENFVITDDIAAELDGTPPSAGDNIEAIELLAALENEGRAATPEEKRILAKYKGWGGIDVRRIPWELRNRLYALYTPEQIRGMQSSMNNAFFTPTKVIDSMYAGLKRMGFRGGNVLETSMGVGNFFGRMPSAMSAKSALAGVELEPYTARIAQYLYPGATVINKPFQEVAIKNGSYDLVIGNVPFGQNKIAYGKKKYSLHNYFIISSLDKVRDGGIVAVITSSGTLDSHSIDARSAISERADVVACFKLPEKVFSRNANTDVQSDLLILRKRPKGAKPVGDSILNTVTTPEGLRLNEYFVKHPENILGTLSKGTNAWGEVTTVLDNGDFYEKLGKAMGSLPKDIISGKTDLKPIESIVSVSEKPRFFEKDGVLYSDDGAGTAVAVSKNQAGTVRDYISVRDAYRSLLDGYAADLPDEEIKPLRDSLGSAYDSFRKAHGAITGDGKKQDGSRKSVNNTFLEADADYYLVSGLERYDSKSGKFEKSALFEKDTLRKKKVSSVNSSSDALAVSLNETGGIDLARMGELTGKSEGELVSELDGEIVYTPEGKYELTDIYLSGNIYEKLDAVKGKPEFKKQKEMLERVIPVPKSASDIAVKLGANYIDPKYISAFGREVLNSYLTVKKDSTGRWVIEGVGQARYGDVVNVKYGCTAFNAVQLLEKILNDGDITATKKLGSGKDAVSVFDPEMTDIAKQKADDIRAAFESWVFTDSERRQDIVDRYNRLYNNYRPLDYGRIADKLSFESMSEALRSKLYPHQKKGIARFLFGGNILFAHGVGTGKTFEMIASVMEARRMGLINKAAMVVPNNKVVDFKRDIAEAYPDAKVLVVDTANKKRQTMLGLVNSNDWDIVLIARTTFTKIPVSRELQAHYAASQLEDIEQQIAEASNDRSVSKRQLKSLITQRDNYEQKLKDLNAETKRDENGVDFEKLGIDCICVDEAHNYKSITTPSKLDIKGLVNKSNAQMANDMLMKLDYLRSIDGKIIFGTGTPITNTVSEIYNMMRMVRPDILESAGIHSLDEWVNTFAKIDTTTEIGIDNQIKTKSTQTIRGFVNASEMVGMFRQFADVVFTEDVVKNLPKAVYRDVEIEGTDEHRLIEKQISETLATAKSADKLKICGQLMAMADAAAVDLRMLSGADSEYNPLREYSPEELDLPESKINVMCDNVFSEYKASDSIKGTQIIFCDKGSGSGTVYSFNLHEDIMRKLIENGIPKNEIVIVKNQSDAQLEALYDKVNAGEVRVLIGTSQKMAEGLNVQKRVVAIHHPTVTYKPSDKEQGDARGVRAGNINKEVHIYRYLQKNTFDSHKWQAQDRKGEMIKSALRGDAVSEIEDIGADDESGAGVDAATAMAITSGNPLVKEKIDIDKEVTRLRNLQRNYLNEHYRYQDAVAKNPELIRGLTEYAGKVERDIALRDSHGEKPDTIIGGREYGKQSEANKALTEAVKTAPKNGKYKKLGEYRGFEIAFKGDTGGMGYSLLIKGENSYPVEYTGNGNNIARIAGVLNRLDSELQKTEGRIKTLKADLTFAKTEVGKPFDKESDLAEALQKQKDVTYRFEHYGEKTESVSENIGETAEKVGVDKSASVRYNIVGDKNKAKTKPVKWRTDLNKDEFKTLMKEVKRAVWRDECHITDTADWLMTKISSSRYPNGIDVFAMYSTENPDDPTVLYESKGKKALIEKAALEIALEEKQNGYVYEKSTDFSSIRIVDRLQPGENGYHTVGHLVPGSRGRNDRTLRKNLPGRPRGAFESVLGNLFEIQDRDRRSLPTGRGDGGVREYRSGVPGGTGRGLSGGRETGKYGADILSGDSGRRRDASAGEQARRLRGDERETQGRDRAERRLFARRLLAGGKTEEITDGTHKYSLVKTDAYNDDMKSIAEKAGEMGVEVGFFVGNALRKFDGRRNFLIDGIKLGNSKVLLRYDGEYAPQVLLMHEEVHLSYGSPDAEEAKNAILGGLTDDEKTEMLSEKRYRDYAALYHGNEDAVLEEFVADVLSGMSDYTERFSDAVDRYRKGERHGYGRKVKNTGDGETKYILTGTGTEGDGRRADIPTGEENRWTAEPTAEKKNTGVTLSDIVKDISDKFGIPIAKGKVTNREASGIYKEKPEVIRTRIQNDLPTISHELGHHLDKMYGLGGLESIDELMEAVDGEFLERYPEGDRPGEAIAEFVRKYLANTNEASRLCPDFYADFVGALSKEDLKALNGVASAVNEYLSYTATERYNAAIVSSQKKEKLPFREKWSNLISKLYTDWVDAFHPLEKVMDYVEEVTGEKAEGKKNAYKLATNSMNAHARTQHIICEEFCDLDGNSVPEAKSFIDSIAMVDSKNLQDLDRYLVLRHSLEWIAPEQDDVSVKRVFADDTLEDVDTIKAQIEDIEKAHPEIVTAAENLYEYQNNLLRHFVVPAGGMTDETVNTLNRKYPNYVPFYRAVGKKSARGAFAKGTFANQKSPINRAKGSGAEIISPLESIIRNTEKMVKFAMRNEVMQVWAEYADKVDGFGQFMEKVPPDSIPHYVSLLGQKESFNDALRNIVSNGEDFFAVSGLLDEIFGNSITDFTPVASAKNKIVTVLRNGRPEYYQIHDEEFYSSIAELSPKQVSGILKISQTIMQPMKLLITQNNPIFAATNAIRDFGTAYKLSETGNIAWFAVQYVKALGGIISNSDTYKRYKAMGGGHSSELSANIDDISKTLRQVAEKDMGRARRLAYALFVHPVETVAKINDAVESVPRFMEFSRTLDAGGDLQEAIYNADDITTNFKRSGKGDTAKAVNNLIMFNNAAIQGLDKLFRTAAKGDAKRRYKTLLKWLLHALLMGVIGYIFNKSVDEEGYKNLSSYKKNNFYNFALGDGYFLSLPKPRENAVLDSFTERLIEYFAGENEEAFYDFGNYLTSQLLPPMFPDSLNPVDAVHSVGGSTVLGGIADVGFNRDFKGTPIESKYDENLPSNERYTENTSKLAYALGQTWPAIAADMSPKKIDHLISSYTGILGQANKALFPMGDSRRDSTVGLRNKFISDSNYSTDVLNRLYENRDLAKKRFNYDKTVGSAVEYEKNAVITSYISEMNKAINALPEDERRGGRAYLLKTLNGWEYGDTSAQSKMISKLDGSDVNTDVIFTELPSSSLEWTVDGQKYIYRMTPQEYGKYVSDYLTVVENARKYYGKGTVESYEAAKQAAKDYMSEYKKSVLKDKYFKKSTAKAS